MGGSVKYPRAAALGVAEELRRELAVWCAKLPDGSPAFAVAGSLRRMKDEVGDVEIVFIPRTTTIVEGLFMEVQVSVVDLALEKLLQRGLLKKRLNEKGGTTWGGLNKLAVHAATGIPVDLFATNPASWFNYLVCRTGGRQNNQEIATAALRMGWKWNPYGPGFSRGDEVRPMESELAVYQFVGLPYRDPGSRP